LGNAFGNNRRGGRSLYNGNAGLIIDHSSLDARPYSFTGQDTARPSFTHMQGVISFGGPLKIPKLLPRGGPNFFIAYQGTRNRNANTQSCWCRPEAQRSGRFRRRHQPTRPARFRFSIRSTASPSPAT
jgi:hypothetical protein